MHPQGGWNQGAMPVGPPPAYGSVAYQGLRKVMLTNTYSPGSQGNYGGGSMEGGIPHGGSMGADGLMGNPGHFAVLRRSARCS